MCCYNYVATRPAAHQFALTNSKAGSTAGLSVGAGAALSTQQAVLHCVAVERLAVHCSVDLLSGMLEKRLILRATYNTDPF